jgi:hypothetical protein
VITERTSGDAHLAWEVELDRLELELLRVDRLLHAMQYLDQTAWTAPTLATPMPEDLLPRAQEIHDRQQASLQKIVRTLAHTRQQRDYADRVLADRRPAPVAVYLDVGA